MKEIMRKMIPGLALLLLTVWSGSALAVAPFVAQCPTDNWVAEQAAAEDLDGDGFIDYEDANVLCMHVSAGDGFATMADGDPTYIFGFSDITGVAPEDVGMAGMLAANLSSPTIVVGEDQPFYLSLSNTGMMMRPDLFDPHTIHWHGFPQAAAIFDGVPEASVSINMMATLTYFYIPRDPGTYMWHCHVEATEHMQMGMLGNLYVTPAQDGTLINGFTQFAYNDGDGSTGYDVDQIIQLTSLDPDFHNASVSTQPLPFALMDDKHFLINGRGYPDTINPASLDGTDGEGGVYPDSQPIPTITTATVGDRILLRVSNLSVTRFFTVTVLGIPMRVVGKDARQLKGPTGLDLSYYTNSVTLGGGEAIDVILETAGLEAGTYFLYSRDLDALNNNEMDRGGMMTEITLTN